MLFCSSYSTVSHLGRCSWQQRVTRHSSRNWRKCFIICNYQKEWTWSHQTFSVTFGWVVSQHQQMFNKMLINSWISSSMKLRNRRATDLTSRFLKKCVVVSLWTSWHVKDVATSRKPMINFTTSVWKWKIRQHYRRAFRSSLRAKSLTTICVKSARIETMFIGGYCWNTYRTTSQSASKESFSIWTHSQTRKSIRNCSSLNNSISTTTARNIWMIRREKQLWRMRSADMTTIPAWTTIISYEAL